MVNSMKTVDFVVGWISVGFQVAFAVALLWMGNSESLGKVLSQNVTLGASSDLLTQVLIEYRQLLVIAREIYVDGGLLLVCSSLLQSIVLFRQWKSVREARRSG